MGHNFFPEGERKKSLFIWKEGVFAVPTVPNIGEMF